MAATPSAIDLAIWMAKKKRAAFLETGGKRAKRLADSAEKAPNTTLKNSRMRQAMRAVTETQKAIDSLDASIKRLEETKKKKP